MKSIKTRVLWQKITLLETRKSILQDHTQKWLRKCKVFYAFLIYLVLKPNVFHAKENAYRVNKYS